MALPQTVDPSTLNLSGKPAIATAPTTTITTPESKGMAMPAIENVTHSVNPLIGGAVGALVGQMLANKYAAQGSGGAGNIGGAGGGGNMLDSIIKAITGNKPATGGGSTTSGGSGTGSGNIGGMTGATSAIQTNASGDYINTKTGETVTPMGNNTFRDSKGNVLDENGNQIGPNFGGGSGTAITTDTGNTATSIGNGYYADQNNNVYDSNGVLVYQNPSAPSTGTQTEPSGGGYDSTGTSGGYFQDSSGDIYDSLGNLVLAFSNGYYYEPDTGNFYDSTTFEPVGTDFNAYTDYFNIPTLDTSGYDNLGDYFDYGNYTSGSTTYIKDGGSVNKGGLPTPLFAKGGYADGDLVTSATPTSFIDQVVANQMPQSSSTTPTTTSTYMPNTLGTSGGTGMLGSLLNFAASNPMLTGAGLGALVTALVNESSSIPTNKPVDMTALGTLKPRTTTVGPARYVPYSEYGTPTSSFDYSKLYENLGVSPFGGGVVSPSTPTSATPTPTTPTGALSALTPTMPTAPVTTPTAPTTTTPTAPTYFSDADGNIYDADGNLVYDTTTGSTTASTGTAVAPATTPATTTSSTFATGTLAPTGAGDAYYSYGTPVNPADILKSKKGGLAKMADGGMSDLAVTSLYDAIEPTTVSSPVYDYHAFNPQGGIKYDIETGIVTDSNGNTMDVGQFTTTYGTHPSNFTPDYYPKDNTALETFYNSMSSIDPSQYDYYFAPKVTYNLGNYGNITGQQIQDYFTMRNNEIPVYNQGMPTQGPSMPTQGPSMPTQGGLMPTQGPAMPTQGPAMPTQGSAMPQQTPFSTSPTFRFSGANNPLLTGLRQSMPNQQPFMLMPNGTFAPREEISTSRTYGYSMGGQPMTDNLNVPVSNRPFQNVPAIQGRGDYRQGAYVEGEGDGQSDDIPAMLADGEYVIDAETVAQLGNGSNKAGAKVLDEFRKNVRAHKRSAPHDKIPPKSKSALAYLKGAK